MTEVANIEEFRANISRLENSINEQLAEGAETDGCTLKHYFTPPVEGQTHVIYARELTIPKGSLIVGKIHKHPHLNIMSKGSIAVATEDGEKTLTAPCTFIAEAGVKRAGYALEETVWTNVHMTEYRGEEDLAKIEQEVIVESYEALEEFKQTLIGER